MSDEKRVEPRAGQVWTYAGRYPAVLVRKRPSSDGWWDGFILGDDKIGGICPSWREYLREATPSELRAAGLPVGAPPPEAQAAIAPPAPTPSEFMEWAEKHDAAVARVKDLEVERRAAQERVRVLEAEVAELRKREMPSPFNGYMEAGKRHAVSEATAYTEADIADIRCAAPSHFYPTPRWLLTLDAALRDAAEQRKRAEKAEADAARLRAALDAAEAECARLRTDPELACRPTPAPATTPTLDALRAEFTDACAASHTAKGPYADVTRTAKALLDAKAAIAARAKGV